MLLAWMLIPACLVVAVWVVLIAIIRMPAGVNSGVGEDGK